MTYFLREGNPVIDRYLNFESCIKSLKYLRQDFHVSKSLK